MIKAVLLSTREGLVFYKNNVSFTREDEISFFIACIQASRIMKESYEYSFDGEAQNDRRYKLIIKQGKAELQDTKGEHNYIESFENKEYNIFGIISLCSEKYRQKKEPLFKIISETVQKKHINQQGVIINNELNSSLDKLINRLNGKEVVI